MARCLLVLALLTDLAYSFFQHYHATLDGDMAGIILPAPHYARVLHDPFGLHALLHGEYYGGSNRFIAHWTVERFYKTAPHALQRFSITPLDSVYLAGAIAKIAMQAALLFLMSAYASGTTRLLRLRFLTAAVLLSPLFQTFGLAWHIGIVVGSPTYSFFYPAASAWLLLFLLPVFLWYARQRSIADDRAIAWMSVPLAWAVTFNGPLNAAVLLLVCPALCGYEMWRWILRSKSAPAHMGTRRPRWIPPALCGGLFFAALSYVVGRFNIENVEQTLPLRQRYALLPMGMREFIFASPAVLVILDAVLANLALVNMLRLPSARCINRTALCLALFAGAFILLLPLGGYRPYRPLIIRNDSIQPVILAVAILYAFSGVELLRNLQWKGRLLYLIIPAIVSCYLLYTDEPLRGNNYCEREALKAIAKSPSPVVRIDAACTIMAWGPIANPVESERAGKLLHYWGIFPEPKRFFQAPVSRSH